MLLRHSLFQIAKIKDSHIAEDQATSVEESEKEDTKSVELPAMSQEHATLNSTKEP